MEVMSGLRVRRLQQLFWGIEELKMTCWEAICEKIVKSARE